MRCIYWVQWRFIVSLEILSHREEVGRIIVAAVILAVRDVELALPVYAKQTTKASLVQVNEMSRTTEKRQFYGPKAPNPHIYFFRVLQVVENLCYLNRVLTDGFVGVDQPFVCVANNSL